MSVDYWQGYWQGVATPFGLAALITLGVVGYWAILTWRAFILDPTNPDAPGWSGVRWAAKCPECEYGGPYVLRPFLAPRRLVLWRSRRLCNHGDRTDR